MKFKTMAMLLRHMLRQSHREIRDREHKSLYSLFLNQCAPNICLRFTYGFVVMIKVEVIK